MEGFGIVECSECGKGEGVSPGGNGGKGAIDGGGRVFNGRIVCGVGLCEFDHLFEGLLEEGLAGAKGRGLEILIVGVGGSLVVCGGGVRFGAGVGGGEVEVSRNPEGVCKGVVGGMGPVPL